MITNCPQQSEAAAFVAGELAEQQSRAFALHLDSCACCRAAVAGVRDLHALLLAAPEREPSAGLAGRILVAARAATEPEPLVVSRFPGFWQVTTAAAAIILGLVSILHVVVPGPAGDAGDPVADGREKALAWFVENQESDGSWDASRWGGSSQFQVALTALPAVALLQSVPGSADRRDAAGRAVAWMIARQSADGVFGDGFQGTPYNHSIATFALLHAYKHQASANLRKSIDRAIDAINFRQLRDGGWGYAQARRGDHSITEWNIEALALADALGWKDLGPRLARARAWQASHPRPTMDEPADSPGTILAVPASLATGPDMYAAYFRVAGLARGESPDDRARLADLRHQLLDHQIVDGEQSGSWPPMDRWGRAGGRLYATALATLALATP